jgi:hypothetical protein
MLLLTNGPHGASEPSAVRCNTVAEPIKKLLAVFGIFYVSLSSSKTGCNRWIDSLILFWNPAVHPLAEDRYHNAQAYHRASHQALSHVSLHRHEVLLGCCGHSIVVEDLGVSRVEDKGTILDNMYLVPK